MLFWKLIVVVPPPELLVSPVTVAEDDVMVTACAYRLSEPYRVNRNSSAWKTL
ncbi:hypothetical protein D3C86_1716600 [compost metagenome]